MTPDYLQLFRALVPEAVLVLGALLVLVADLTFARHGSLVQRRNWATALATLACAVAVYYSCDVGAIGPVFGDVLELDRLALATRIGVLLLTLLTLGVGTGAPDLRSPAEYVVVVLFASVGLMLMAAAQQLLLVFLALELASLSLYVLVGFDQSRPTSAEAGLKYFLFGGMAAAFLLFGFSLLYGLTGSIQMREIATALAIQGSSPLLSVALVMILVAFGFKAAAAPFHFWAPDAYQGAPATGAALIASASKLAGLVLFLRLLWPDPLGVGGASAALAGAAWMPVVVVLSALSLLLGNLVALAQTNVRRLLAYSAIAHAGALLLGVLAAGGSGAAPLYYYAATYGIATVGAFGVIGVLDRAGGCQSFADLAGLRQRSPFLAVCLLVFVLSLAGIPPLAGFFGKFYVFAAALGMGGLNTAPGWLAFAAILLSAVGLYYYLLLLKQAFVLPARADAGAVAVPFVTRVALLVAAGLIVGLGLWPSALLARL